VTEAVSSGVVPEPSARFHCHELGYHSTSAISANCGNAPECCAINRFRGQRPHFAPYFEPRVHDCVGRKYCGSPLGWAAAGGARAHEIVYRAALRRVSAVCEIVEVSDRPSSWLIEDRYRGTTPGGDSLRPCCYTRCRDLNTREKFGPRINRTFRRRPCHDAGGFEKSGSLRRDVQSALACDRRSTWIRLGGE